MILQRNVQVKPYTTFGIEAIAAQFALLENNSDVIEYLNAATEDNFYVLGGGSNTLFTSNFDGIIIHLSENKIEQVSEDSDNVWIKASAGVVWDDFVKYCTERGLGGVENLSYIPGNVGASPVQNIGAYGTEAKDSIAFVEGFYTDTKQAFKLMNEECRFGYRDSIFKHELKNRVIITHVTFKLDKKPVLKTQYGNIEEELKNYPKQDIATVRKAIIAIRKRKLPEPKEIGNCGSFFKNPTIEANQFNPLKSAYPTIPNYPAANNRIKIPAAWLIEQCGFKGIRKGNAGVHQHQALVLINLGNATGQEVINLANEIIDTVHQKFGIELEKEVNVL